MFAGGELRAIAVAVAVSTLGVQAQEMPTMPMGMNLGFNVRWSKECTFIDAMKSSSDWITYHSGGGWNTKVADSLEVDENGYPLEIPQTIDGNETRVRFLVNNYYEGRYVFLYDGEGEFEWHVPGHEYVDGKHYINFQGEWTGNKYIHITRSVRGNHVRNIRILPVEMEDTYDPAHPFRQEYLDFLRPFQIIRFMPILGTNGGFKYIHWEDRPTPSYYNQNTSKGMAIEHCIQLCNELDADMWFNVPHPVWDDWIINAAELIRDSLKTCLNVYIEYSNELWNWASAYPQSNWVIRNGRWDAHPEWDCADSIYEALSAISPETGKHPEKDAYMMARVFNIWRPIFEERGQRDRLFCVGAVQGGYTATVKRVMRYLFEVDGGGCDVLSPASYFGIPNSAEDAFDAMDTGSVTKQMIFDSALAGLHESFAVRGKSWLLDSIAEAYGVALAFYEGGSHMYDYNEHHWSDTLTALHGDSLVYELYRTQLTYWHDSANVVANCMLSTIAGDYSTFAHITDYSQIYLPRDQMMEQAPKYLAITDACAPKRECTVQATRPATLDLRAAKGRCHLVGSRVSVSVPIDGMLTVDVCTSQGRRVARLHHGRVSAGATAHVRVPVDKLAAGVYLVDVDHQSVHSTMRMSVVR